MTAIARLGDIGEGNCPTPNHGAYTTEFITGANSVFINNLPTIIIGSVGSQSCGHTSEALTGSGSVFAENLAVHRIGDVGEGGAGDLYTCVTGSDNVFNNGD